MIFIKKHLKILSIIGLFLVLLAFSATDNWGQYVLEIAGFGLMASYAWKKMTNRVIMLWVSGFFVVAYTFVNFSLADLFLWALAFGFVYRDKPEK